MGFWDGGVGVVGSLLSGVLGGKNTTKESWKGSYGSIVGQAQGAIEGARRTGFNPLTLLGLNPAPVAGNEAMGQALSDAAMFAADAFLKKGNQQALQVNAYQNENRKLQERLVQATLQPTEPGVYGRRAYGSTDQADSGNGVRRDAPVGPDGVVASAGLRPLATVDPIDSRRAVDNKPVPSSAGFVKVDNPNIPFPLYLPSLDGDETIGPDFVTVPLAGAAFYGYHLAGKHAEERGNAIWDEFNRKKRATAAGMSKYRFPQDTGYTVRKRKAPYLP